MSWAKFTALNTMPKVQLQIDGVNHASDDKDNMAIRLHNPTNHIAFFERVSVTRGKDGDEVVPILYSDNYVTLFPRETVQITSTCDRAISGNDHLWLKLEGYNTPQKMVEAR